MVNYASNSKFEKWMERCGIAVGTLSLAIVVVMLTGCDQQETTQTSKTIKITDYDHLEYWTVVLEGCEYFAAETTHGYVALAHKGNCTNSIHIYAVENK